MGLVEEFSSEGNISINNLNNWEEGLGRNTYSNNEGTYITFDQGLNMWVYGSFNQPTNNVQVVGNKTTLVGRVGLLPDSYGNIHIDNRLEHIPAYILESCEPEIFYNIEEKIAYVSFAGTTQSGIILT